MSYSDDIMKNLTYAIREFNGNIYVLKRLTMAIEEQNKLMKQQIEQNSKDEHTRKLTK